jgi:hypothetical protein
MEDLLLITISESALREELEHIEGLSDEDKDAVVERVYSMMPEFMPWAIVNRLQDTLEIENIAIDILKAFTNDVASDILPEYL